MYVFERQRKGRDRQKKEKDVSSEGAICKQIYQLRHYIKEMYLFEGKYKFSSNVTWFS